MLYRAVALLILVGLLWSKALGIALIYVGAFLIRCC